ncbi:DinB family protein [Cellulomonas carbonis]|uniref:DinB family protein n=1 Tax=Cellulomonas carbonis TaxID=1386092 RepID=UPI000694D558|nr:DinB family protein [Cellulomonas carbonis]GGC08541.1 mini-circle protein [Cellulomonas carbonis]
MPEDDDRRTTPTPTLVVDEQGRPEPPLTGDELSTLLGFLEFHRATLAWKCSGLDAAALRATLPPSTMTLGGLLKHLAYVEDSWFGEVLLGQEPVAPWDTVDWSADRDWDWHSAADDEPDALRRLCEDAVVRARRSVEQALADGGLDRLADRRKADGSAPNLRWILVHMVEEYARHNGHADLLREAVDGATGE